MANDWMWYCMSWLFWLIFEKGYWVAGVLGLWFCLWAPWEIYQSWKFDRLMRGRR